MSRFASGTFISTVSLIIAELGETWRFNVSDDQSQVFAHSASLFLRLRFAQVQGDHDAIAVEIVDEDDKPITYPPGPPIYLLGYPIGAAVAASRLRDHLIAPHLADQEA